MGRIPCPSTRTRASVGRADPDTLVELTTTFLVLLHLADAQKAKSGTHRHGPGLSFPRRCATLTWDQGKEMAQHLQFSIDTGVDVYFCDPHSPGSPAPTRTPTGCCANNFPTGTDPSVHTPEDLQAAADSLNGNLDKPSDGGHHPKHSPTYLLQRPAANAPLSPVTRVPDLPRPRRT